MEEIKDPLLEEVIAGIGYSPVTCFLVKPLEPIMVSKDITTMQPTGIKDENGVEEFNTETETKEVESNFRVGIILKVPTGVKLDISYPIGSKIVYEAMKSNLESICTSIKMILEKTPPELAKDIIHSGIYITGGGSQLAGLDQLFEQIAGIKVICSECPEESAVRGLVQIVSDSKYKRLPFSIKK